MIIEVTEIDYMGFHLKRVENTGWKIVLNNVEYIFPTMQDAQAACRQFYDLVKNNGGKKIVPEK